MAAEVRLYQWRQPIGLSIALAFLMLLVALGINSEASTRETVQLFGASCEEGIAVWNSGATAECACSNHDDLVEWVDTNGNVIENDASNRVYAISMQGKVGLDLRIQNVSKSDEGIYQCRVIGDQIKRNFTLWVEGPQFCGFEHGMCGWKHGKTSDGTTATLHQHFGLTDELETGPRYDATLGAMYDYGQYLYLRSNGSDFPQRALLLSPELSPANHSRCFVFWYHMYGDDIGHIAVHLKELDNETLKQHTLFDTSGDQGVNWHFAKIDLPVVTYQHEIVLKVNRTKKKKVPTATLR